MIGRRGVGRVGRPSLVGTVARTAVVAGTATAVVGGVRGSQQAKAQQAAQADAFQQQQQQEAMQQAAADAVAQAMPPPAPAAAPAGGDVPLAQLEKLAKLYQQGILNAEEFAAKAVPILVP